ncbi:MFS transporter [Leucobacter sp. wl10]|uniref:MFS transporter n=1 Tax=Leucobacter sp. wl10 TaxID=2304677 RepID=UPI000E8AC32F|nr:MFS transporter [Leucobacter sp. wl10]RGE24332.1 MFS transporter [Leucobacter sp. wl10]
MTEETQAPRRVKEPPHRRALAASVSGQALEWYDFALYGLAAAIIFPRMFFPDAEPVVGVLASFATFAVGFIARPVGGFVFGRMGDRIGRARTLMITILLMGIGTMLIGAIPSFESIGLLAPILLVMLRLIQGLGIGGEWSGAAVLVVETSPRERRGFLSSMINSGEYVGTLVASGLFAVLALVMPQEAFQTWGWRVPFLLSGVGVLICWAIRRRLEEPETFTDAISVVEAQPTFMQSIRAEGRHILGIIGLRMFENASAYIILAFAVTYAESVGVPTSTTTLGVSLASVVAIFLIPVFGGLSDRIGRRKTYTIGAVFLILFFWPFFLLLDTNNALLVWVAFGVAYGLGMSPMLAVAPAWFAELFPTRFRYSGTAISANIATVLAGGLAPFIAVALMAMSGNLVLVMVYLVALAVISLLAARLTPETAGSELR